MTDSVLPMTAVHRQRLLAVQSTFATLPHTKLLQSETKLSLLEMEIGRMVGPMTLVQKRLEGVKMPLGTSLDGRRKLFKAYMNLENTVCKPVDYEDHVESFELVVTEQLEKLRSRSLAEAFQLLQVELKILACVQNFRRNEEGGAEDDLDAASKRFRSAVKRLVMDLRKQGQDERTEEINNRVTEVVNCLRSETTMYDFVEAFDEQGLRDCLKALLVEIQERMCGPPRMAACAVDASLLEAAARSKGLRDFAKMAQTKVVVPPTPARDLVRANRALADAAGKDPLSALRQSKRPLPVQEEPESSSGESSSEEERAPVSARKPQTTPGKQAQATPRRDPVSAARLVHASAQKPVLHTPQSEVKRQRQQMEEAAEDKPQDGHKKRRQFSKEEDDAIRAGVRKYGEGQWQQMKNDVELRLPLSSRTSVNLKDRWRVLKAQ